MNPFSFFQRRAPAEPVPETLPVGNTYALIYDGPLSENLAASVRDMLRRYPFVVECASPPPYDELKPLFAHRTYHVQTEDCMGIERVEVRQGIAWGYVSKYFGTPDRAGFFFMPDREAYDVVCGCFAHLITNPQPFQTRIA